MPTHPSHDYVSIPGTPGLDQDDSFASDDKVETLFEKPRDVVAQPCASDEAGAYRAWAVAVQRRQLRYFLVLLAVSLATLFSISTAPYSLSRSTSTSRGSSRGAPKAYHPTLVGPRRRAADGLSTSTSCSTDDLLEAIKGAKVRPDGASTHPDFSEPKDVELVPIEWSFDLGGERGHVDDAGAPGASSCEVLKVYSPDEACELLSAFGGLYLTGDSLGRHIFSALLMILRGRIDGAVTDFETTSDCRGEHMFDDGKTCRTRVAFDTHAGYPVCGGQTQLYYAAMYQPNVVTYDFYRDWRDRLPKRSHLYSPIFVTAFGAHFNYEFSQLESEWWPTSVDRLSRQYPVPLNLFAGPHKPGENFPQQYMERQGPHKVRAFKQQVEMAMRAHSPVAEAALGGWRYLDFYGMSEGALSYDSMHYSLQVNLEKAHLLLNVLDTLWGEIVESGGLAELRQ
ncbi:hypothetical protein JCM3775_004303 [Rhodotorula graminis]